MNSKTVEISVIMATYHPVWDKCLFTLESIIAQKNVDWELIITDDGSEDNLFSKFESYLNEKKFTNFRLLSHDENQGTVKNYYDGISACNGKYVKLISPGDALYNETTLEKWLRFLKDSGNVWSFAEATYYTTTDDNHRELLHVPVAPRLISCYLKGKHDQCRWNYVVLEDMPLGAAILCDRKKLLEYIGNIVGLVKFAEDTSLSTMMYDGILPAYYSESVVFYEFGVGVSTGNSKWRIRFQEDMRNFETFLINRDSRDEFQKKMTRALTSINSGSALKKKIMKALQKGGLRKVIKYRLHPRKSSTDCSGCGVWWNNQM